MPNTPSRTALSLTQGDSPVVNAPVPTSCQQSVALRILAVDVFGNVKAVDTKPVVVPLSLRAEKHSYPLLLPLPPTGSRPNHFSTAQSVLTV